jgi:tubulin-specific chaperone A
MSDKTKTKNQLIDELQRLRLQIAEMQKSENKPEKSEVEHEQLLADIEHRALQLQTAAEISHAASSILDLNELLTQTVELIRDRFNLSYTGLFLIDETGQWLVLQAGTGEAGRKMIATGHKLEVGGQSMVGWCVVNKKARIALEAGQDAVRFSNPLLPETRSELVLPLVSRGEVIGAMTTQSDRPAAFTQEDIIVMQTMADQLAIAITNARLFTERKQEEERLASERNLMRAVIDSLPDYVWSKDADGRFVLANIALAQHMGAATPDDLVGKTDFDFYPQELAAQFYADEQALVTSGQAILDHEEATQDTDGNPKWTLTTKVFLRDKQGKFVGSTGVSRDITARKVAEAEREQLLAELARQQYILDNYMENVPDLIYFKDLDSRITRANRAYADLAGLDDPAQLIGKSDFDFYAEDQARVRYEQEQEIIRTGQPILNLEESDGKGFWVLTTKMPLRNEKGEIIGTFGISHDITAVKKVQTALEQAYAEAEVTKEKAEQARKEAEFEKASAEAARVEAEQARKETEAANQTLSTQMWQTTGQALLNDRMRGEQDIRTLAANVINQLCEYLNVHAGMLYKLEGDELKLAGTYAYRRKDLAHQLKVGEKQAGQAALGKRIINVNIPDDYITNIYSSLGDLLPKNILAAPFVYEGQVIGVVQIESLTEFTPAQMEFLEKALESMAIAFTTAAARAHVNELLNETQQQAEELQAQSEELRVANEELETQTKSLQASETALKEKQNILDQQNRELMIAQEELERKAKELALASKYKSEFLANMSHELRTPLNSLLILARMLADNKENNLTPEQIESAQIIHSGGTDLLNLINDILDLSKVEAGQMVFNYEAMPLTDLVATVHMQFDHMAEEKGIELRINLADGLPGRINTDPQRLRQIIKNLLSNAFKFTKQGSVSLDVYRPDRKVDLSRSGLDPAEAIAISVADTGIGMTPEQLKVIFEAFQQADGSTSRQYGGTGLGLSISRELAANMGGQIDVTSAPGQGSTFTLYLPIAKQGVVEQDVKPSEKVQPAKPAKPAAPPAKADVPQLPPPKDDRQEVAAPDERDESVKIVAIIEDDPKFAKVVYNYAHKKGFKCLIAGEGQTGLELVRTYQPEAVILDLNLPDMSGWEVLSILKNDPGMRHIPVHIMSVDDEDLNAFKKGAMGYLTKPVSQEHLDEAFGEIEHFISQDIKSLLLVEDDANSRMSVKKLLDGNDVQISEADNGQQALDLLRGQHFDCMILDLSLPDMSGFEVLNKINDDDTIAKCPVIIYTGRELTPEENMELMQYADRVIVKGVKSPERLLDETALFLHRVVADMPQEKQQTIKQLYNEDELLKGKRVLVVDDDMRNSFALSKLLSDKGIIVKIAKDGQKALDMLNDSLKVDLILMDIMMPEMDGYETIKRIRAQRKFNGLPILALTAKAMKGDREKCLEVGANDYLPKPVDVDRLISMLRVWLYQ